MTNWKKSFRKIPETIQRKAEKLKTNNIRVGCVVKLSASDIADGAYDHLGISLEKQKLSFPSSTVPDASAGRYSDWNANGEELVRKDLPMVTKAFSWESPNYGDWSNGSHTVEVYRDVYQREFVPPAENEISIELLGEEVAGSEKIFVFRFLVNQPLSKRSKHFGQELFRLLNLLQECVGAADVFATDASLADYLRTIYVNWEILPAGEREGNIAKIAAGIKKSDEETRQRIIDRYDFFDKLKPEALVQGTGGFRRYFGAKFSNELVAFENMEYGNAIYIMRKNWQDASQKTKQELMASGKEGVDFFRVIHGKGWKTEARDIISKNRK